MNYTRCSYTIYISLARLTFWLDPIMQISLDTYTYIQCLNYYNDYNLEWEREFRISAVLVNTVILFFSLLPQSRTINANCIRFYFN